MTRSDLSRSGSSHNVQLTHVDVVSDCTRKETAIVSAASKVHFGLHETAEQCAEKSCVCLKTAQQFEMLFFTDAHCH